jgi:hypothetical protein
MLPNLIAPIWSTRAADPTNILFEAALSFLGVGIRPHPELGRDAVEAVVYAPAALHVLAWMAIFTSRSWPSTCSATGCATPSIHEPTDRESPRVTPINQEGIQE